MHAIEHITLWWLHEYSANDFCTYPRMDHICHLPLQIMPHAFADSVTCQSCSHDFVQSKAAAIAFWFPLIIQIWIYCSLQPIVAILESKLGDNVCCHNDYGGYSLKRLRLAASWKLPYPYTFYPLTCGKNICLGAYPPNPHALTEQGKLVHNKYYEDNVIPCWR